MEFFHCFSLWIAVLNTSSCWSNFWTLLSSSNIVHTCVVLSNSCVTFSASLCITSTCMVAYCSLSARTFKGLVGVNSYLSSSISFLQSFNIYAMIWIYSSTLLMACCALSGIIVRISFNFCSKLFVHSFFSFVSIFTYLTTSSRESFPFLVIFNSTAIVLSHDCTSYMTLAYIL